MCPRLFSSWSEFQAANPHAPKWEALGKGIEKSTLRPTRSARSIGSSATYWCETPRVSQELTNSQMYQTFLVPLEGSVRVEISPIADLDASGSYKIGADAQHFVGKGKPYQINPKEILAIAQDEAWRYDSSGDYLLVVLRISFSPPFVRGGKP